MNLAKWGLPLVVGAIMAGCGSSSSTATGGTATPSAGIARAPGNAVFCDKAKAFSQLALAQSQQLLAGAARAQSDPEAFKKQLADLYGKMGPLTQDLANSAPDSIKGDIEYLAGVIGKLLQVSQSSGDVNALSQQFAPVMSDPKFAAATQHLTSYAQSACGIAVPTGPAAPSGVPSFAVPSP